MVGATAPGWRRDGIPSPIDICRERAEQLGLPYVETVHVGRPLDISPEVVRRGCLAFSFTSRPRVYVAPNDDAMPRLAGWLAAHPELRRQVVVAPEGAIRAALMEAGSAGFLTRAVAGLVGRTPQFSAVRAASRVQLLAGMATLAFSGLAFFYFPGPALLGLAAVGGVLFSAVTGLRLAAAFDTAKRRRVARVAALSNRDSDTLPIYSVLVPVRDEAALMPDLLAALSRLDWPTDRLDIKIIVDADDRATLHAARRFIPGPPFELVVVPDAPPRTKPKALAYALPFARGALVTIYDAEDRPHSLQLREAHARFAASDRRLACLQAPLVIDNHRRSTIARMFAVEYAALFDGLLPTLARLRLPLPLGGTSNHFRREVLDKVGGWDPFNVTEDADLGIRLARYGYRTGTLTLPTYEEAPPEVDAWMRQRTRWFKGWLQTWLVHMRQPAELYRDLGLRQTVGFHLISTAMLASAFIHPLYLLLLAAGLTDPLPPWSDGFTAVLMVLSVFNLAAGYLAMAILAWHALALRGLTGLAPAIIGLPAYWLFMSFAAYRGLFELALRPHHWGKTPHEGRRRQMRLWCPPVSPGVYRLAAGASRGPLPKAKPAPASAEHALPSRPPALGLTCRHG